jgi:hypothetical protein
MYLAADQFSGWSFEDGIIQGISQMVPIMVHKQYAMSDPVQQTHDEEALQFTGVEQVQYSS